MTLPGKPLPIRDLEAVTWGLRPRVGEVGSPVGGAGDATAVLPTCVEANAGLAVPPHCRRRAVRGDRVQPAVLDPLGGGPNPLLINDPRYAPAGVLAPKSRADLGPTPPRLPVRAAHRPGDRPLPAAAAAARPGRRRRVVAGGKEPAAATRTPPPSGGTPPCRTRAGDELIAGPGWAIRVNF